MPAIRPSSKLLNIHVSVGCWVGTLPLPACGERVGVRGSGNSVPASAPHPNPLPIEEMGRGKKMALQILRQKHPLLPVILPALLDFRALAGHAIAVPLVQPARAGIRVRDDDAHAAQALRPP